MKKTTRTQGFAVTSSNGFLIALALLFCHSFYASASQLSRNDMRIKVHPKINLDIHNNGLSALSSFKGTVNGCQIQLSWGTKHEIGHDYFEIERSIDGQRFFSIGSVKGAGNSISPQNYQYFDDEIFKENYYYRLKLVDFNGDHLFSNIIEITTGCQREGISIDNISPNPMASNWLNVKLYTEKDIEGATIVISDKAKRPVKKVSAEIKPGMNIVPFDSKGLENGTYQIQIIDNNAPAFSFMFTKED